MLGHRLGLARVLLLTTIGQKTGKRRETPIAYFPDGNTFVLIASNYGAETDPLWLRNLRKHPQAQIQVGSRVLLVEAHEALGGEQERLAAVALRMNPTYAQYRQHTKRAIPLVVLRPCPAPASA
ncbi:MAG: nitroreductase family deazaflavin-dependent oxidoreductase [Ktedonobacterales bacterium]|nr:nitroreductase family deazaflavin-dependent oxidoreductase [Ktedonobacterales bacterium]